MAINRARNATRLHLEAMTAWAILSGDSEISLESKEAIIELAIGEYARSRQYRDAHQWARNMIIPIIPHMNAQLIRSLIKTMGTSDQIKPSWNARDVVVACSQTEMIPAEDFSILVQEHGLTSLWHPTETLALDFPTGEKFEPLVSEIDLDKLKKI
ncbi:hypothetical protein OV079_01025 [Nannocystis pusilla]|uniref:Uncharacterized protein n=1 Tax=Nannocystis pusilla TaxID=889268 RepID=A0A9X3EJ60_9BACT|nr:hypothetical protein [Nannocystis pusilla]MCY1004170.1 hypothetical protein [Nannocystis pusilla]